jgi:small basic protein
MLYLIIAVLSGILLGLLIPYNLSSSMVSYVAVAIIAALDSVFGGLLANFNKRFNINVFLIGLVSNAVLGIFLTFIGNVLGISLSFAVIIVFGVRMFNNMAAIRRLTLDKYFEKRARDRERERRLRLEAARETDEVDVEENEAEADSALENDEIAKKKEEKEEAFKENPEK